MTKIFISYRRQETKAIAGRIFDRLEAKFGRDAVFMDIDSIPPGADFHDWLNDHVAQAALVLALIGPGWADARDEAGNRRLDNPNDFVRIELEAALARKIPLVPLLIDGAPFPPGEYLPESLRPLTRRNAAFLDAGRDFNVHIARIIEALERHLSDDWITKPGSSAATQKPELRLLMSGANIFSTDPTGKGLTGIALNARIWNTGAPSAAMDWELSIKLEHELPVLAKLSAVPEELKLNATKKRQPTVIRGSESLELKTRNTQISRTPLDGTVLFYTEVPRDKVTSQETKLILSVRDIYGKETKVTKRVGDWLQ